MGFFSEEKRNFIEIFRKQYKKVRLYLSSTHNNSLLQLSGFVIQFEKRDLKYLDTFFLYTEDPQFGMRKVMPGNKNMLYKCNGDK